MLLRWGVVAWVLAMAGLVWRTFPYTVDDAFIVGRYASHLAAGQGYVMNPGGPVTDGVTGPLWLLPGWLASLAGADPVLAAKMVGGCCALVAGLWLLMRLARRSGGQIASVLAALVLLAQPTVPTWAVAGLSPGLAMLLVVWAMPGVGGRPAPGASWAPAIMCWLRPELVPTLAILVAMPAWLDRGAGVQRIGRILFPLGLGLLTIVGFRAACFGTMVPLSAQAKPALLSNGMAYLARALLMTTGGVGLIPPWLAFRLGGKRDRVITLALGVGLVSLVLAGGDWMPGFRMLAPLMPLFAWLFGVGIARWVRSGRRSGRRLALAVLLCALALVVPVADAVVVRLPAIAEAAASREGVGRTLAAYLASRGGRVALVDVGALAFESGVHVIDLGGVTDPEVGHLPGGHLDKRIPQAWFRQAAPDRIVVHSATAPRVDADGRLLGLAGYPVERRIAAMPWVRAHFRVGRVFPYAPGYFYAVLERRPSSPPGRVRD